MNTSNAMYHQYFGLSEPAFAIAVNPKYLYMSSQHKEAIAHLLYGIQGGGFVLLSGEVGTGKTTIIRQVLSQLPDHTESAFILNPMAETQALLATICEELHIPAIGDESSIKSMMDALQHHLLNNFTEGKRTVLIIDEAQLLSAEVLEQIRLLTNLETDTQKLLQIILVGQPEINDLLDQPRLRQLSQRITARYHLTPLDPKETKNYVEHRLHVAGLKEGREIFPKNIIKRIHQFSGGVPRLINIICERMLIGAYGHNQFQVDKKIFLLALNEIKGAKITHETDRLTTFGIGMIAALVLIAGIIFLLPKTLNNPIELDTKLGNQTATVQPSASTEHLSSAEPVITKYENPESNSLENSNLASIKIKPEGDPSGNEAPNVFRESGGFGEKTQNINPLTAVHLFISKNAAYRELFRYYSVELTEENYPCWQTDQHSLNCNTTSLETWQELEEINRPGMLTVITEDKNLAYVVVVGVTEDQVYLIDQNGFIQSQSKEELGKLWNGRFVYLWRRPQGFKNPIVEGSRSPTIAWIAEQFASLDGQDQPITEQSYTLRLKTRVKIFQTNNVLKNDGVIGERTLMKLNEKLGLSPVLIRVLPKTSEDA